MQPAPRNLDEIKDIKKLEYESLPHGLYETPALKNKGVPAFVTPHISQRRLLSEMEKRVQEYATEKFECV